MNGALDLPDLIHRFDIPPVNAIALMGSHARGDAGPYSDVDFVRFLSAGAEAIAGAGSHLIDGRLVVVSDVRPAEIQDWFSRPDVAVNYISGLRRARPIVDRDGSLAALQNRAHGFQWDEEMQRRADRWAGEQMVGWIEEAHKGLEGLRRNDVGRLHNALFGLSWGLSRVVQVQRGVLLTGDNTFFDEVEAAVGADTEWATLRRRAFGVMEGPDSLTSLREQVVAGLRLYIATVRLIASALQPPQAPMVHQTVERISAALPKPHPC